MKELKNLGLLLKQKVIRINKFLNIQCTTAITCFTDTEVNAVALYFEVAFCRLMSRKAANEFRIQCLEKLKNARHIRLGDFIFSIEKLSKPDLYSIEDEGKISFCDSSKMTIIYYDRHDESDDGFVIRLSIGIPKNGDRVEFDDKLKKLAVNLDRYCKHFQCFFAFYSSCNRVEFVGEGSDSVELCRTNIAVPSLKRLSTLFLFQLFIDCLGWKEVKEIMSNQKTDNEVGFLLSCYDLFPDFFHLSLMEGINLNIVVVNFLWCVSCYGIIIVTINVVKLLISYFI